jgi:hypothetical protein
LALVLIPSILLVAELVIVTSVLTPLIEHYFLLGLRQLVCGNSQLILLLPSPLLSLETIRIHSEQSTKTGV